MNCTLFELLIVYIIKALVWLYVNHHTPTVCLWLSLMKITYASQAAFDETMEFTETMDETMDVDRPSDEVVIISTIYARFS